MDAVEFIKEYQRMCAKESCRKFPAFQNVAFEDCDLDTKDPEGLVNIVEQWSQSHPQKTMMQDFFEKFPNAPKTILGFPYPCAKDLGYPRLDSCSFGLKNTPGAFCKECWSRPLEE